MKLIELEGHIINADYVEFISRIEVNEAKSYFIVRFASGERLSINSENREWIVATRKLLLQRMYGREIPSV
jgi:hypothetical protein